MSAIILPNQMPTSWFAMVSPRAEEMPDFLKLAGQGWRTPKRKWEYLWRLRRGDFNCRLGKRHFGILKKQRGILHPVGFWFEPTGGGTNPVLENVDDDHSSVAPTPSRQTLAYDSDGRIEWDETTSVSQIVYAELTTQTDDVNDHSDEWWPDAPDVNEGLNWDIMYSNDVSTGTVTARHYFKDSGGVNRTISTWYLLDTVSNDHADASQNGAIGVHRNNGTAKNPDIGVGDIIVDVDIRATGSGGSVAGHTVDLQVEGT